MGSGSTQPVDDGKWKEKFFQALDRMDVGPGTHWVDLYHATVQKEELMEIQLDNRRWTEMEQALAGATWPTNGVYTSVRFFVVIQDPDDPTRPAKHASTRPSTASTRPAARPNG
jgi:hypothetical protein